MANTPNKTTNKKPKLVRDSFTIPKAEYVVIEDMKVRAIALGTSVKKSELLRAGLKLLQSLSDSAYKAALAAIPTLKTGRPAAEVPAAEALKVVRKPAARKATATAAAQAPAKAPVKPAVKSTAKVVTQPAAKSAAKPAVKAAAKAPVKSPVKAPTKPAAKRAVPAQKARTTTPAPAKATQPVPRKKPAAKPIAPVAAQPMVQAAAAAAEAPTQV